MLQHPIPHPEVRALASLEGCATGANRDCFQQPVKPIPPRFIITASAPPLSGQKTESLVVPDNPTKIVITGTTPVKTNLGDIASS